MMKSNLFFASGVIFGALVAANPLPQIAAKADAVASLQQGSVKGSLDSHGNAVYLGIPFAETTGGENRYVSMTIRSLYFRSYSYSTQMESAQGCEAAGKG